jgi:DMSO/TMAO reductase YedYZ molybdopterin-dependent catalytic subunit
MTWRPVGESSAAALGGLAAHYALFYVAGAPLWTEAIAEWIMARTPNAAAVWLLGALGAWAKPLAVTGGLAALGFTLLLARLAAARLRQPAAAGAAALAALAALALLGGFPLSAGWLSFSLPAAALLAWLAGGAGKPRPAAPAARRQFLAAASRLAVPAVLGAAAVAVESFLRDRALAARAVSPTDLYPFLYPRERESFAPGLVRAAVTSVDEFYGMSKNAVDPAVDPASWRLRITAGGRLLAVYSYQQLLSLPRVERYVTLRCVSNTLRSNLQGTAEWSGIFLRQLIDPSRLPAGVVEVAFVGVDGHDDSLPAGYAFSSDVLLALGMNGKTLNRVHGFPIRLLCPCYYGFKSVKWISEIRLTATPYTGLWPRMGYTKEPLIHTVTYIDRIQRAGDGLRLGGIAYAGDRGIRRVVLRADGGAWVDAVVEEPLSPYTWNRWKAELPAAGARVVEARALDGSGRWQAERETPLFPNGVAGPTIRKLS